MIIENVLVITNINSECAQKTNNQFSQMLFNNSSGCLLKCGIIEYLVKAI